VDYGSAGLDYGIAVGDFNADGVADLAVACDSYGIYEFLGRGDGSFGTGTRIAFNISRSVVAEDFDGDGKEDLAAFDSATNSVALMLGTGNGSFRAAVIMP
jgi:hypothetical protein